MVEEERGKRRTEDGARAVFSGETGLGFGGVAGAWLGTVLWEVFSVLNLLSNTTGVSWLAIFEFGFPAWWFELKTDGDVFATFAAEYSLEG
jgi:hypothetical protein